MALIWFWNGCPSEMHAEVLVFRMFPRFLITSCGLRHSPPCVLACAMIWFHVALGGSISLCTYSSRFAGFTSDAIMCPTAS